MNRKARGTLAQELGKTVGGVCAFVGSVAFFKVTVVKPLALPGPSETVAYGSALTAGTGDLFAPFAASNVTAIMWMGLAVAVAGTLLRVKSHWNLDRKKDS